MGDTLFTRWTSSGGGGLLRVAACTDSVQCNILIHSVRPFGIWLPLLFLGQKMNDIMFTVNSAHDVCNKVAMITNKTVKSLHDSPSLNMFT